MKRTVSKYIILTFTLAITLLTTSLYSKKLILKQEALYKITTKEAYNKANSGGCIELSALDKESGFIHAAYGKQVEHVLKKFFKDREVIVLELDKDVLRKNDVLIKPEANKPGGEIFPHLYRIQAIPLSAIINIHPQYLKDKNMKSVASDNNSGVHPQILDAIHKANVDHAIAYGDDPYTEKAINKFKEIFGSNIDVYFVYGGTGANVLGLEAITEPFNGIFCAENAHINVDECGAPEKFTGCKLLTLTTTDGKISVEQIKNHAASAWIGDPHHVQPKVISITQTTELGTVYTPQEIKAITDYAHSNGMYVHMDGARLANAIASLNVNVKDITTNAGIDVLSFGGTKNGMMFGEAVVFFDEKLSTKFEFIRKQGMQLASKMRFIAVQFEELLSNNLWLDNAKHANKMAKILGDKAKEIGIELTQKVESNAVFAKISKEHIKKLQEKYFFYVWDEEKSEVRWMTSFDTTEESINDFVKLLGDV